MGVIRYKEKSFMAPIARVNLPERALSCILQDGPEIDLWNDLMMRETPRICEECLYAYPWTDLKAELIISLDVYREPIPTMSAIARCPRCGKPLHSEWITGIATFPSVEYALNYTISYLNKMQKQSKKGVEENGEKESR